MLPKSRIWSALVLGLGVALLAAGISAGSILNFSPKLPLDAEKTTWTLHDDNGRAMVIGGQGEAESHESDEPDQSDIYEGPVTYQVHMDIGEQSTAKTADLRIGETTVRSADPDAEQDVDNLYNARVWSYPIDRETGEAEDTANLTHTIAMPGADVDVDGYWLKFPAHAEKTNYPVFDSTLRQAREAVFAEEMDIDGRTVYRYHQDIAPENVAKLYAGMLNTTSLPKEDGGTEQGFLFHSAANDFYVDQETGMLVGMDLDVDDFYGDADGNRASDALRFKAGTSEEDRSKFLAQADDIPDQSAARIARWVIIGLGALLSLLGLAGVLGLFGSRGKDRRGAQRGVTGSPARLTRAARPVRQQR